MVGMVWRMRMAGSTQGSQAARHRTGRGWSWSAQVGKFPGKRIALKRFSLVLILAAGIGECKGWDLCGRILICLLP